MCVRVLVCVCVRACVRACCCVGLNSICREACACVCACCCVGVYVCMCVVSELNKALIALIKP